MSTLKTHNLQSPDAGSVNVAMTPNAGMVVTGISTFNSDVDVDGHTNLDNVNIAGVTTSTGNIYADNYFGNGGLTLNNNGNPSIILTSTSTTGSSRINFGDPDSTSVGKIYYVHDGDYLKFDTAYNERLRIDSDGKLLIGITASTSGDGQLQSFKSTGNNSTIVVGNVATSASGLCRVDFCPSNKVVGARIECHATEDFASVANRTADLVFVTRKDGTNAEKLRITSTGQFVVGTNPTVSSGNIVHIEAPTSFNSGETIVNIEGNNAAAAARIVLHNNNTGGSAYNEILGADAGGQSTSSIRFYNTDQGNNYGEIAFGTRNASGVPPADRMRISKDGYVTKPHTPAFFATHTGADNNQTGYLVYNTSGNGYYNNGGHFNVSTGAFTAPVTGIYFFHFHGFLQVNVSVGHFEYTMRRANSNGSGVVSVCRQYGYRDHQNQYGPTVSMMTTQPLTAGQTMRMHIDTKPLHGSNGYYFGGYLIG